MTALADVYVVVTYDRYGDVAVVRGCRDTEEARDWLADIAHGAIYGGRWRRSVAVVYRLRGERVHRERVANLEALRALLDLLALLDEESLAVAS